jgi:multiple RNA-binding domain-containing protein 1
LPYELTENAIGDGFRPFGEIQEIRIARNWKNNQSKGFAFVVFKESESAKAALLKLAGKSLKNYEGRSLKIDFDVKQKPKKSLKANLEDEGNVRFNKQIKKEIKLKLHRKEVLKKKMAKAH